MKVAFVVPNDWSSRYGGGAEYQSYLLISKLSRSTNFNTFYICRNLDKNYNHNNINIIPIRRQIKREYPLSFDVFNLYKTLKIMNPDIIYQRVGCAYTGVCAYYTKRFGKRMIWHVCLDKEVKVFKFKFSRNLLFKYIDMKFLQYGIKNSTYIIGQTEHQNDLLKKNFGRKCYIVVPNFHPKSENEIKKTETIKIIWVSNIKKFKRPELFIKLAKKFQSKKKVKFLMIGRKAKGKWQNELENRIAELNNLNYLGERPIEEVNKIMGQSHIFVNTSHYEGFPNTYIQAWMRKVPVISLNVDPDDIIKKKNIGFHSGSFEKMVIAVGKLIENTKLREEMGEKAQKYAFRYHSLENNLDKIVELILQ